MPSWKDEKGVILSVFDRIAPVPRQNRICTLLQPIDDGVAVWFVCPDINLPSAPADDRGRLLASPEGVKGLDHLQTVPAENSV